LAKEAEVVADGPSFTEALLEGARSAVEREIDACASDDGIDTRVDRLVDALHRLTIDKEHLLRQMIRFTIDQGPIATGVPPRPSRRLEYVDQALAPLRTQLVPDAYERLTHAMAVVIGIEARIVLRDICGLDDVTIVDTERWAAHALVRAALSAAAVPCPQWVSLPPSSRCEISATSSICPAATLMTTS
jgi:hypothetical protein